MVIDASQYIPEHPTPKFRIGEREPLFWLVSILFTSDFWHRDSITRASLGLFGLGGSTDEIKPAQYPDWASMYRAVEEWVENDPRASACYKHAKEAIAEGKLSYYAPEADEWGVKPYHEPERDVESFPFIMWAESNNYPVSSDVVNAARTAMHMMLSRQQHEQKMAHSFPAITREDLEREKKRPLWRVGEAIMYAMGKRARSEGKEAEFGKNNDMFKRLLKYVGEADQAEQLEIIAYDRSFSLDDKRAPFNLVLLEAKVKPAAFLAWAKELPVSLAMLHEPVAALEPAPAPVAPALPIVKPEARTPEMQLMFAAIEHFEKEYPAPKPWPTKTSIVTPWLHENAPRFGIEKLSKNMADAIDTLMRPMDSRAGGIKPFTGLNP